MQTKRDLLQAHRLMTHRASQALVLGEPDYPEQPLRKMNVGTFAGIMVGVLVAAVFGIIGLLVGGGSSGLEQKGVVLMEKETGALYVWCTPKGAQKDVLCPVANYTSAKLAASLAGGGSGGNSPEKKSVSAKSLSDFARGPMIGISGAPASVPEAKRLVGGPWSVCVRQNPQGGTAASVVSLVGGRKVGGEALDPSVGVVVSTGANANWLIWKNQRMRLAPAGLTVLGASAPAAVSPGFVNALPAGPDFAPPNIPGAGGTPQFAGAAGKIGQVFVVKGVGGGDQPYVLMADGYAPISALQAALIQNAASYRLPKDSPLDGAAVTTHRSAERVVDDRLPQTQIKVRPYDAKESLCVVYPDAAKGSGNATLTVGGGSDLPMPAQASGSGVDNVVLPPGSAVLAGVLPASGSVGAINTYALISDDGRRYSLKSADTAKALGYSITADDSTDAVPVPANLLNLVPQGPVLDPQRALEPIQPASGGS
ncbi:type VII secretion protein EccB [Actinomadura darangshiensis]|uniref:Type VII secretion protein EccB n=1 Tax=Actinomadura darangshiensis TaxID=705336 RepID=A0A4R5B659_9ACTN|nr:type VII secretion protein EccB [Actinomadura darangshiensis]TDD80503.1 type VII secretion protein EccB [Actinomadura darangshiensis]